MIVHVKLPVLLVPLRQVVVGVYLAVVHVNQALLLQLMVGAQAHYGHGNNQTVQSLHGTRRAGLHAQLIAYKLELLRAWIKEKIPLRMHHVVVLNRLPHKHVQAAHALLHPLLHLLLQ